MNYKSLAIIFTIVALSLIINFFQYLEIKNMHEREVRLDRLLDKWQHEVENYKRKLLYQDTL